MSSVRGWTVSTMAMVTAAVGLACMALVTLVGHRFEMRTQESGAPASAPSPPSALASQPLHEKSAASPVVGKWRWISTSYPVLTGELELLADGRLRWRRHAGEPVIEGQYVITGAPGLERLGLTLRFRDRVVSQELLFSATAGELVLESLGQPAARYARVLGAGGP